MPGFAIPLVEVRMYCGSEMHPLVDLSAGLVKGAVGSNSSNLKPDVQLIQQMLNAAAIALGPEVAAGTVDGVVGPITTSAIKRYQLFRFGISDGRIEPGKATIRSLAMDAKWGSSLQAASPMPVTQLSVGKWQPLPPGPLPNPIKASNQEEERANRAYRLLKTVIDQAVKARRVLDLAFSDVPMSTVKQDAIGLVFKHFASREQMRVSAPVVLRQINGIRGAINQIYSAVVVNATNRARLPERRGDFVGVQRLADHPEPNFLAETMKGGAYSSDARVFLGPLLDTLKDDAFFAGCCLHELSHSVGAPSDAGDTIFQRIDDLYPSDPMYQSAHTYTRVRNASFFENFAVEASAGTATIKRHTVFGDEFDRLPVLAAGLSI